MYNFNQISVKYAGIKPATLFILTKYYTDYNWINNTKPDNLIHSQIDSDIKSYNSYEQSISQAKF